MHYAGYMDAKTAVQSSPASLASERRWKIAAFFREHRLLSGMSVEQAATAIDLEDASVLVAYEAAVDPIPLDMIFALTNLLNIPPEDTMNLVHDVYGDHG